VGCADIVKRGRDRTWSFRSITPLSAADPSRLGRGGGCATRHKQAHSIIARDRCARLGVPFTPTPSMGEEGSTDDHDHRRRPRRRRHVDGRWHRRLLAGYCGSTRRSCATDLRLSAAWCGAAKLPLSVSAGRTWSSSAPGWQRTARSRDSCPTPSNPGQLLPLCEQEGLIARNPAANLRQPRVDYESRTLGLSGRTQ
jgi:hypothetical protein